MSDWKTFIGSRNTEWIIWTIFHRFEWMPSRPAVTETMKTFWLFCWSCNYSNRYYLDKWLKNFPLPEANAVHGRVKKTLTTQSLKNSFLIKNSSRVHCDEEKKVQFSVCLHKAITSFLQFFTVKVEKFSDSQTTLSYLPKDGLKQLTQRPTAILKGLFTGTGNSVLLGMATGIYADMFLWIQKLSKRKQVLDFTTIILETYCMNSFFEK